MSATPVLRHPFIMLLTSLALLGTACATPAARPLPSTSAAVAPAPSAAAVAGSTATGSREAMRIELAFGESEARYRAQEQFAGRALPREAVGSTQAVTGSIALDDAGKPLSAGSRIVVDLRSLQSGEPMRDNDIRGNVLGTSRFPTAAFVPTAVEGLLLPLPASGEATFQLFGDLTLHGATRPSVWEVVIGVDGQEVTGSASTQVQLTDFNVPLPRVARWLSIDDIVTLVLSFHATSSTGARLIAGGSDRDVAPADSSNPLAPSFSR